MAVNKVFLVGNVGNNPKLRTLESGAKVASFSIATTDRGYKKKDGEEVPSKTEWHDIIAWNHHASFAGYAKKGDKVSIVGKLKTQEWDDNGVKKSRTSIVVEEIELPQRSEQVGQSDTANKQQPEPIADGLPF